MGLVMPLLLQVVSGFVLVAVLIAVGNPGALIDMASFELSAAMMGGLALLTGVLLAGSASIAAILSPVPFRARLGLFMPHLSWAALLPVALVGLSMTQLWGTLWQLLLGPEAFSYFELFGYPITNASPLEAVLLGLAMSVSPGISEELLFRGYVQTRLLQRWSAPVAIAVSTALFSFAHLHPLHVLLTLPLGMWLGIVAYRTGSILPSMVLHMLNNGLAMMESRFEWELTLGHPALDLVSWLAIGAAAYALLWWLEPGFRIERRHIAMRAPTEPP